MPHRGTGGEVTMSKVMQQSYRECGSTYVMAKFSNKGSYRECGSTYVMAKFSKIEGSSAKMVLFQ